jgi:hypothetical protein
MLAVAALVLLPIGARAETFDYTIDRFEADGNVSGPFDGTPDEVDEFDDGVLAPWAIRRGTASESGGMIHVQSPGLPISLPGLFPVAFEASAVGVSGRLHVGSGDGVLRVVLPAQAIGANDAVSFDFSTIEGMALYYGGVVLTNFNSSLATGFDPDYPVGLAATAHLERISFTNEVLASQHHPIVPSSVTGPIVLELRYDDATQHFSPAVSVDGGATFHVFDPLELETDSGDAIVQVAVAAYQGSCPAGQTIRNATFGGMGAGPGKQRLKMRIAFPSDVIVFGFRDPLRFVVTDEGAGGATLYDITLPDGITAFQHACDPRDRWIGKGYVNKSNALPPACVPGSAQGFRRLRMSWTGVNDLRFQVRDTTIPNVVGPIRVTTYDGTGPVNECDGWVGDVPCAARGTSVRCLAPTPP